MFTYNYFESKTFLPFKWRALESIQDKIFNVFSDVWAYGDVIFITFRNSDLGNLAGPTALSFSILASTFNLLKLLLKCRA